MASLWGKCRGEFDQITRANGRHQSEEKPRNRPETGKNAGKNGNKKNGIDGQNTGRNSLEFRHKCNESTAETIKKPAISRMAQKPKSIQNR